LAQGGFQLSPPAINGVLTRFDPNRVGLTLEAFTEVALFLASLRYLLVLHPPLLSCRVSRVMLCGTVVVECRVC
jgi:hypothetical protein